MTEEEARTKWCPMSRVAGEEPTDVAANRDYDGTPWGKCMASDCMMWRLVKGPYDPTKPDQGYCGLTK